MEVEVEVEVEVSEIVSLNDCCQRTCELSLDDCQRPSVEQSVLCPKQEVCRTWRSDSCVGIIQQVAEMCREASLPVTLVVESVCLCSMHNTVAL